MNKGLKKFLIFFVVAISLFCVCIALGYGFYTQFFFKTINTTTGEPILDAEGNPLTKWGAFHPEIFSTKLMWTLTLLLFGILFGIYVYVNVRYKIFDKKVLIGKNDRADSDLFDNQSFMSEAEKRKTFGCHNFSHIEKNEDTSGFVISSEWDKKHTNIMFSTIKNNHAVLIGTTGTGKSTFIAGPTIQVCAKSSEKPTLIINDISGELFRNHSKELKANGYDIAVINLHTPRKGLRFNPLSIIWDMYHEYHEKLKQGKNDYELLDRCSIYINEIANFMCISDNKNNSSLEWQQGAKGIVQATIWAMLEDSVVPEFNFTKDMFTIAQLSNIINKQKAELLDFLFNRNLKSKTFDYAGNINDNQSEKTVSSYLATLSTSLSLFLETGIQYLTSATDIDLSHIADRPTAIFVIVPPEYPERYIISSMLYSQIYNNLVYTARNKADGRLPRTVYYILDEFGNLPKIKDFPTWIATSRKMRIFFFIMLQSNKQLDSVYGKEQAQIILNNCQANMFLGSSEFDDIERFKKLFGTYTAINRSQGYDTDKDTLGTYKGSTSLVKKDLVTTSELQQIPQGTMYTYLLRNKPMKSTLVPIFDDDAQKFLDLGEVELNIEEKAFENIVYDLQERKATIQEIYSSIEDIKAQQNEEDERTYYSEENDTDGSLSEEEEENTDNNQIMKNKVKKVTDFIKK